MRAAWSALIALACLVPPAHAEPATPVPLGPDPCAAHPRASFEVATVKPSDQLAEHSGMHTRSDSVTAAMTLKRLILSAYDLRDFQVSGGPGWINDQSWEIQAKIDPPEPSNRDEAAQKAWNQRRMERLQSVLADRFQLKCHVVTKELPVYELVVAKGGPKFAGTTAPPAKQHSINSNGNSRKIDMKVTGISMAEAATSLSGEVERIVVDRTRLTGSYDFDLTFAPAMATPQDGDPGSVATIFTALEEQLGLKLVPAKGPVPVLVIDSVEKPSEN